MGWGGVGWGGVVLGGVGWCWVGWGKLLDMDSLIKDYGNPPINTWALFGRRGQVITVDIGATGWNGVGWGGVGSCGVE